MQSRPQTVPNYSVKSLRQIQADYPQRLIHGQQFVYNQFCCRQMFFSTISRAKGMLLFQLVCFPENLQNRKATCMQKFGKTKRTFATGLKSVGVLASFDLASMMNVIISQSPGPSPVTNKMVVKKLSKSVLENHPVSMFHTLGHKRTKNTGQAFNHSKCYHQQVCKDYQPGLS